MQKEPKHPAPAPGIVPAPDQTKAAAADTPPATDATSAAEEKKAEIKQRRIKARKRRRKALRALLLRTLMLLLVVYVLFFHVVGLTVMPNGDMYPRIDAGDMVLFYRLDRDVQAQDIIVIEKSLSSLPDAEQTGEDGGNVPGSMQGIRISQEQEDGSFAGKIRSALKNAAIWLRLRSPEGTMQFVCRVIAVSGDTVEITDEGLLLVNGNHMVETNIFFSTVPYLGFQEYPVKLQPGECFVLADLRAGGADSRFFGPVKTEEILGTVITIMRRNNL